MAEIVSYLMKFDNVRTHTQVKYRYSFVLHYFHCVLEVATGWTLSH